VLQRLFARRKASLGARDRLSRRALRGGQLRDRPRGLTRGALRDSALGGPPDQTHNYGHGRFENLAGVFEGIVLVGVGAYVVYQAVNGILYGVEIGFLGLGVGVMVFSAVANFFVSRWLIKSPARTIRAR
jgi:predicted Co/Zn/Cd cation transporter (cation efflux family)